MADTDLTPPDRPLPVPTRVWVLVLTAAWLLPGLFGHDPWKPLEAPAFGVIYEMVRNGHWLVPTMAGEPVVGAAPLFYWICALTAKAFGGVLFLHDAARIGVALFTSASIGFVVLALRELSGPRGALCAFLLLLGCLGFVPEAHQMVPDLAMFLGYAAALYGLSVTARRPVMGGVWVGFGIGVVALGQGPVHAVALVGIGLVLPLISSTWRNASSARSAAVALAVSLPFWTIWPMQLHAHSPSLFRAWADWHGHLPLGNAKATIANLSAIFKMLSWHSWPVWPLAIWGLWSGRRNLRSIPGVQIALAMLAVVFILLIFDSDSSEGHKLPLLLPLTVLATHGVMTLRRGAANAMLWFSIMFFFLFALTGWVYWAGMDVGIPARLHAHLLRLQPNYEISYMALRFLLAAMATIAWFWVMVRMNKSVERPILAWTTGTTLIWVMLLLLFGNYMDAGRSYRSLALQIRAAIPAHSKCIGSTGLGPSQIAMFHYFGDIVTEPRVMAGANEACPVLLIQTTRSALRDLGPAWKQVFIGARPGDKVERYQLFTRVH